jgi:hypothetical protein
MGIGPSPRGTSPRPRTSEVSLRARGRKPLRQEWHREHRDGSACVSGTVRSAYGSASATVDECGPKSPDSHRVVWGLTSQPPGSPAGLPPASRLPAGFSVFARRPLVSLRPTFSSWLPSAVARFRFPSVSLRVPYHPSSLHGSVAARAIPPAFGPGQQGPRSQYCREAARLDRYQRGMARASTSLT